MATQPFGRTPSTDLLDRDELASLLLSRHAQPLFWAATRDRIILSHTALVVTHAQRYRRFAEVADLVFAGFCGLCEAVDKFEVRHSRKVNKVAGTIKSSKPGNHAAHCQDVPSLFHAFARLKIHSAIVSALPDLAGPITCSESIWRMVLSPKHRQDASPVMARRLDLAVKAIRFRAVGDDGQIHRIAGDWNGGDDDVARKDHSHHATHDTCWPVDRAGLERMVERTLNHRDRQVIRLRFGLGGVIAKSLEEVAELMGISSQRVGQLERRAVGRLRRAFGVGGRGIERRGVQISNIMREVA